MLIKSEDEEVLCIINFNKVTASENIDLNGLQGNYRDVFLGEQITLNNSFYIEKEAGGFCILEKYKNLI